MSNLCPSGPTTFRNLCTRSSGEISKVVDILQLPNGCDNCTAVVRILKIKVVDPAITVENCLTVLVNIDNEYALDFEAYPDGCPMAQFPLRIDFLVKPDGFQLFEYEESGNKVHVRGLFPANTRFQLRTNVHMLKYFTGVDVRGAIGISSLADLIACVNNVDANTNVLYVSSTGRPQIQSAPIPAPNSPFLPTPAQNPQLPQQYPTSDSRYPWDISIIPYKFDQPIPLTIGQPSGNPVNLVPDEFDKRDSVPRSIFTFFGNDPDRQDPKDFNNTIFLRNLVDRGYTKDCDVVLQPWESVNDLKKQYQSALTADKLKFYLPKLDDFVGKLRTEVITGGKPLVSTFRQELNVFFLQMHVGYDIYPEFVLEYFNKFMDFIGAGNPNAPGRNLNIMYGNIKTQDVKDYFATRANIIAQNGDKSTLIYWWQQSGMPQESVIFEAIHNIVAFSQFNNTMYGAAVSTLDKKYNQVPPAPLPPTGLYIPNFFDAYHNALTEEEKVGICRETYRILSPNSASFSLAKTTQFPGVRTQSRHIHQQIMLDNTVGGPVKYFTIDPIDNYPGYTDVDLSDAFLLSLETIEKYTDAVYVSPKDQEMVSDRVSVDGTPGQYQPVLDRPSYVPFGFGYRACAGQTLSLLVLKKIFDEFCQIKWVYVESSNFPKVPVAPFKTVYDNIFAEQLKF